MDPAVGSLVISAAKMAYELWKDGKTDALALTEDAKHVVALMQSDPTNTGTFIDVTGMGDDAYVLRSTHHEAKVRTSRRVVAELEAKGLVTIFREDRGDYQQEYVRLTHFGWILNPQTGKADKVG